MPTVLRGMTWNHSRALPPLAASAQRFEETHPGVEIQWSKRTLHEFGHADLQTLADRFDLLIIDHPMAGDAEQQQALLDLLPMLSPQQVADFKEDAIGNSFLSYVYRDKLFALPVDAAAPAASFRPDLLQRHGFEPPRHWDDVLDLARAGLVRMPGFSADLFLNFLGLCVTRGAVIAAGPKDLVDNDSLAIISMEQLRELAVLMPAEIFAMNPIALYEEMAAGDSFAYCPFAYTYSNYSRAGFAHHLLQFDDPVVLEPNVPIRTVVGGTGIAISRKCKDPSIALEYCLFTTGRECQRTLYGVCGGQPARRSAWHDSLLNQIAHRFFLDTSASMERAWVRPRYPGYVSLQVSAGDALADYCKGQISDRETLQKITRLYRHSVEAPH